MNASIDPYPGNFLARRARDLYRCFRPGGHSRAEKRRSLDAEAPGPCIHVAAQAIVPEQGSQLREIFRGVEEFPELAVYVHGSWADDTRTPFSDLDDLILVDEELLGSPARRRRVVEWLNAVDMSFCRLDPLQHHGHWIIDRRHLRSLDESFMPLSVLQGAICLQGPLQIEARVDLQATLAGLRRNVEVTALNIERLAAKFRGGSLNLYEAKGLVGAILLMPAYLWQLRGRRCGKREAIETAHGVLKPEALAAVRWASVVRASWGMAIDRPSYRRFSRICRTILNPHLHRAFASKMAPLFPAESFAPLDVPAVSSFLAESRKSARHAPTR